MVSKIIMLHEVREYFGFTRSFDRVGYFETEDRVRLVRDLKTAICQGRLIAVIGAVGCGKTALLQRLKAALRESHEIRVSCSLALDKERLALKALVTALLYDLSPDKDCQVPTTAEKREQKLLDLMLRCRTPVVLFVDDAHEVSHQTIIGLKQLVEVARENGAVLSVVLGGQLRLQDNLHHISLEGLGGEAAVFTLEGMGDQQREYIEWMITRAAGTAVDPTELLTQEALSLLASRPLTPLQVKHYLAQAFEEAYRLGAKPVTADIVAVVLKGEALKLMYQWG